MLHFFEIRDNRFIIHNLNMNPVKDSIELLFNDNRFIDVSIVNYNNKDMLICLTDGYVNINNQRMKLQQQYFVIKANSITNIKVEIDVGICEDKKAVHNYVFIFKYKGLLFNRKLTYKW